MKRAHDNVKDRYKLKLPEKLSNLQSHYFSVNDVAQRGLPFSEVLIFGAGHRGRCLKDYFLSLGCSVHGFLDNDKGKQTRLFEGLDVISIRDAVVRFPGIPVFYRISTH